ncbi:hypothetical protein [Aurantimonas sp. Leaf443]|uniref:hypothetical protein n=1 Tax=Aurantimonas sp. Leaf443 TaxID=1736378 RepID=UPI0006FAD311|nr:hypothetical protein [Aurantimonas sp. Leaf443]KQT87956.1 hypothetical protein ASG48_00365 [Aurantimonas sp. Leaf443]
MIALTLIVCLNATPGDCRPEKVAFEGSVLQCAMFGQAAAAQWLTAKPKWHLKKWRCDGRPLDDA